MAVLQTQGLTGIAFVELTAGSRDSPPLQAQPGEEYPVIKSGPSLHEPPRDVGDRRCSPASTARATTSMPLLDEENRRALRQDAGRPRGRCRERSRRARPTIDAGLARRRASTMENTARFTERAAAARAARRAQRRRLRPHGRAGRRAPGASATGMLDGTPHRRAAVHRRDAAGSARAGRGTAGPDRHAAARRRRAWNAIRASLLYGRPQPKARPGRVTPSRIRTDGATER